MDSPAAYKCDNYIHGGHPKAQQQGMPRLMPSSVSSMPAPQLPASSYGAETQMCTSMCIKSQSSVKGERVRASVGLTECTQQSFHL